jgi:hypothetical protein
MINKIKEALITRWSNQLGIKDEKVFEGVAISVEPFITSDEQLTQFVEGAKSMLTQPQSYADKVRTELNAKLKEAESAKAELEAKLNGNQPPEPKPNETPDITALIEAALDKKLNPITERLTQFETAQSQKSAVAALDNLKASWDYAKGYPSECEDAYERVMELYEVSGKKWTADELTTKFKEKFNKAVSKKGVDTTKPFQSDGGVGTDPKEADAAFAAEIRRALGKEE